jgi:hypothetical protein
VIKLEYISYVGDLTIKSICERFPKLEELSVVRNCNEKTSKITDNGMLSFKFAPNIERLTIEYTRYFDRCAIFNLALYL